MKLHVKITDVKKIIITETPLETTNLAQKIGNQLKGGEVIELIGDLGTGKTTFVNGLAKALDCKEDVSSPTFTVCNTYHGRLKIEHCDFYRLSQDDKLISKEIEDLLDPQTVLVLEWSENVDLSLENSVKVFFEHQETDGRKITIETDSEVEA